MHSLLRPARVVARSTALLRHRGCRGLAISIALVLGSSSGIAQQNGDHGAAGTSAVIDSAPTTPFCFRARPLRNCAGFLVTELGAAAIVGNILDSRYEKLRANVSFTFGAMRNVTSVYGIGAIALLSSDMDGALAGTELRFRRWIGTRSASADFGVGWGRTLLLAPREKIEANSLALSAAVSPFESFGVYSRVLLGDYLPGHRLIRAGAQVSSAAGGITMVGLVVLTFVLLVATSRP
jgi:hypothetical protein